MTIFIVLFIFSLSLLTVVFPLRKWGAISPPTLFTTASIIYNLLIPLEFVLTGQSSYSLGGRIYVSVTPTQCLAIAAMALFANTSFLVGYNYFYSKLRTVHGSRVSDSLLHSPSINNLPPISYGFIALLSLLLLFYFYSGELKLSASSYEDNYKLAYSDPGYFFLVGISQVYVVVTAVGLYEAKSRIGRLISIILFLLPIYWGIITSDKNPILLGLIGVSLIFLNGKSYKYLIVFFIVVLAGMLSLPFFSAYRAKASLSEIPVEYFSILRADPRGPFVSLVASLEGDLPIETNYFTGLITLIPKFVWPERPLDASNVFASNNIVNWLGGQGLGYSLLGEAYYNLGYLFFLVYLVLGGLYANLIRIERKIGVAPLIIVLVSYEAILCHRASVIGQIKDLIYFTSPVLGVLFVWNTLFSRNLVGSNMRK